MPSGYGNITVIYVILRHRKMRNVTNFFLANLAVSDLCVGIFCILPNLTTFLSPYWILGKIVCKLYYFIQCTSYTASVLILTVISLERYFAIIHPMLNKRITRMCLMRVVVVIIWICAALYGVPNLVAYDIYRVAGANGTLDFCVITGRWTIDMDVYSVINFVVLYLLPLLLISAMYTRISRVLWRSGRNMGVTAGTRFTSRTGNKTDLGKAHCTKYPYHLKLSDKRLDAVPNIPNPAPNKLTRNSEQQLRRECSMNVNRRRRSNWLQRHLFNNSQWARSVDEQERIMDGTCSCDPCVPGTKPNNPKPRKAEVAAKRAVNPLTRRRKVIRLLICIIVSFAICVLPHHIRLLWQNWSMTGTSLSFGHMLIPPTTFFFFYANSALNPFLYALLSDHFRRAFHDLMPSWCHRPKDKAASNGTIARESRVTNLRTSTLDTAMKLSTVNMTVV
ncbi:hypothetical protein LSH36_753g00006 [Paralvinella palmiformis]|uniref:G-protein coupled receptors family 1 profile domain-containing protein n=1 Tax=Paralvinella palmiformis TaxID=53620 RepID=A0AAD9J1T5_9ANNE|nr:hypothetical protein LSH36_753g00006 [Paralvinella palmiformis]